MTEALLSLKNVTVRRGNQAVLKHLDFEIYPGDRIILKGENGTGKTTLLKTALGFIQPESGMLEISGRNRDGRFAYLPQELLTGELPISVAEVVDIGLIGKKLSASERRRKITHLLEALGCEHLKERSFATLSGGEKQRVSLARCMAQAPELLALDEPTAGLDPEIRGRFYPMLQDLADFHGAAVLLVTHDTRGIPEEGWRVLSLEQRDTVSVLREDDDV